MRLAPTSTWPPELYTGRMFALLQQHAPAPLPPGVASPVQWGDPNIVRERLGAAVKDVAFDREPLRYPMLSPAHGRTMMEQNIGPMTRLVKALESDPAKLTAFRRELEELITIYFEDSYMRQDFLMTRAVKV